MKSMLENTALIKLCVDCMHCKTRLGKYYCSFERFYKNSYIEIILFTPEDHDCADWEGDETDDNLLE